MSDARERRRHRGIVTGLFALAALIGFFACFAVWANRQVLSTSNWSKTSTRLLANPQIQDALSVYLVNELFTSAKVPERLEAALPAPLNKAAGPLAAGLKQLADRGVPQLLATRQVQELWRKANLAAHAQLLRILKGGGKTVATSNGTVTLDLHELLTEMGTQLGLTTQVAALQAQAKGAKGAAVRSAVQEKLGIALPASGGKIVIMRASQLKTAQDITEAVRGLAILLPFLTIALFALAVWLADGWRRGALRTTGWCLAGIGIALLLLRRVAGNQIVDNLVAVPANRAAAQAAWSITTTLLYDIAIAMLLYGLVVVFAAWVAGHTRPATNLRHVLAPWLREHSTGAYASGFGILLLIVLWGPTPATRQVIPVLGFAALTVLAVWALRRQTTQEFPNAQRGEVVALLRDSLHLGHAPQDATAPADRTAPAEPSSHAERGAPAAPAASGGPPSATQ